MVPHANRSEVFLSFAPWRLGVIVSEENWGQVRGELEENWGQVRTFNLIFRYLDLTATTPW
jgi:hypothetical protein